MLFTPLTLQSKQPSIIPLSPLPPISSLPWSASVALLDGWGYGFSFFFSVILYDCCDVPWLWHVLKLRMQSLILSCLFPRPWLSITVTLLLKREVKQCNLPLLAQAAESAILFFTFDHSHWATCLCMCFIPEELFTLVGGQEVGSLFMLRNIRKHNPFWKKAFVDKLFLVTGLHKHHLGHFTFKL